MRITATAMPMELRVAVLASAEIGCASPNAKMTMSTPTSIGPDDIEQGLGVPVNAEPANETMQQPGQEDHLESEGERRRQIQVVGAGAPGEQQRGDA